MGTKNKFSDRLRYAIDNTFSKGTIALIGWLGILSLIIIVIAALLVIATGAHLDGEESISFIEAFWRSLMRTLDAGTMGGDTGWDFRLIMFLVTIGGVFIISTLIGVLTAGVEGKLEELRKGRSKVIEEGHTVILGWSPQVFTIINELVAANENQPRSCIVVLGDHDKVEMEEEIKEKAGKTGKTRIVCRSGSPMEMEDLTIASLNTSKSIIVLSPDNDSPDSEVIKTVLAITNHPDRREQPYQIVVELRDPKNYEVARIVGKDEVEWIQVGELVARVIAQTCRQSGLSVIYTELLDFGGDEIYFTSEKALIGKSYGDTLKHYEKNAVMGICPFDAPAAINPPMDTVLRSGDQLIVVAEDDDKIFFNPAPPMFQEAVIIKTPPPTPNPEHILILGWNWRGSALISELNNYVAPDSQILVAASHTGTAEDIQACSQRLDKIHIEFQPGDTTDRRTLEALGIDRFAHIILLSYSDTMDVHKADAQTLITLLHLRDITEKSGIKCSIVSEMLDIRNRQLAEVTRADDFIVSDKLVSLMMAQVSENKYLNAVFTDMFDPEGSEIYLKPASQYIQMGQPVNFYTVIESARQRGETAIGYRLQRIARDAAQSYGVVLNPAKSNEVVFSVEDNIVVLADN